MAVALPSVTMIHPSGRITKDVFVGPDVAALVAEGWTFQSGSAPSYTLRPPAEPAAGVTKYHVNGRTYEAIDATIDTRQNATISDPDEFADVAALLAGGWTLV